MKEEKKRTFAQFIVCGVLDFKKCSAQFSLADKLHLAFWVTGVGMEGFFFLSLCLDVGGFLSNQEKCERVYKSYL